MRHQMRHLAAALCLAVLGTEPALSQARPQPGLSVGVVWLNASRGVQRTGLTSTLSLQLRRRASPWSGEIQTSLAVHSDGNQPVCPVIADSPLTASGLGDGQCSGIMPVGTTTETARLLVARDLPGLGAFVPFASLGLGVHLGYATAANEPAGSQPLLGVDAGVGVRLRSGLGAELRYTRIGTGADIGTALALSLRLQR